MNSLIQITTDGQGSSVVSARELHGYLESKKQFADWIKNRIEKYGLIESQDYTIFSLIGEKGRPLVEYVLTLDVAKELAMVEGNLKGKQARRYFIDCEKKLRQVDTRTLHTLATQQRQIEQLRAEVLAINNRLNDAYGKQPVGGSIPHQANSDRLNGEIVPPVSQNRAIIGIPPYRPAHPRTGVDLRTPSYVVEQYEHIQRLRRQGYKGAQLASKAGLSKGQISKIESRFRSISYRPAYCIKLIVPSVRLYRHTSRD